MRSFDVKKPSSDDALLQICKDKTGKNCSVINWSYRPDLFESSDDSLMAIIVELDTSTQGSVRVYKDKGKAWVGMVGNTEDLVIIPWEEGYTYMCILKQRVGEVR